ncbi:dead end protein 1 isoform X1 [Anguilla anguilla]|uniref:dead end protein 1 isoform X1 n=1 Tax=Anguilla anguilla TaxID=7936 RepID=UPI0015A999E8|nr:dead end protein 1 isoform X1 [Anguilla anguilla]
MEVQRKQILNQENLASLESWVQRTAIKLVQVNGQRKYGGPPPDWTGPAPGPGCEVFISQIPRDIYEDKLIPLFQSVGPLYEFRLMMNFSGQNRGFAYAKYRDPQSAAAAIRCLHQHQLQQGAPLTVRRSTEKRQLCLGDLPAGVDRERLLQVLRGLSEGVESVSLKFGKGGKKVTAIVHYTSHYNASMAKKVICEAFKRKFGIIITVKWFSFSNKPKQDEDEDEEAGEPFPATKGFPKPCPLPPVRPLDRDRPPPPPQENLLSLLTPGLSPVAGCPPPAPRRDVPASTDAVALLLRVCEVFKVGPPLYDLQFLHAGADGFLYFAYRVLIPGLPVPFSGVAQILPGTSAPLLRGEVQRVAAERILKHLAQP